MDKGVSAPCSEDKPSKFILPRSVRGRASKFVLLVICEQVQLAQQRLAQQRLALVQQRLAQQQLAQFWWFCWFCWFWSSWLPLASLGLRRLVLAPLWRR